ncbi:MAG: hypothetical protein FJ276_19255 [Planctomycetes bacterium]|nr:hypothetical protein [Planctomycetota bacterium]
MAYAFRMANVVVALFFLVAAPPIVRGAAEDLGNGFSHHGVATPVSNHRGTVATADGDGRNVVLVWLFDHRGGYALLMIDAETGKSRQLAMPFPPGGDCPYASILSSANRYYTHFNSHFVEFDPAKQQFTFFHKTAPQMAMSMTEDERGVIWSVTYPNSGLVSYDPATGKFTDYGHLHQENWLQYPRYIAADDAGWIYFGVGSTHSHILAFDPSTREVKEAVPRPKDTLGYGYVYRDLDGSVYGHHPGTDNWYRLRAGTAEKIGTHERINPKPIISSSQGLFHRDFPDGKKLRECDLVGRVLVVEDPRTGETNQARFDYTSEGAHIMGLAAAPDGTICGGTAFPMHFFSYDPDRDQWTNRPCYGQWNTVARQGDRFFVGGYGAGFLLEWDPASDWIATEKNTPSSNPRFLVESEPTINRPHELLAHLDGKTLVLAGTPGYGHTGGGLLFWDRETKQSVLLDHSRIIPQHSTMALVPLPDGRLLGGTTTAAGTGGEQKAAEAELFVMDIATKKVEWHDAVFPGVQAYTDLCLGPKGLVYGIADRSRFFVFDPGSRTVTHESVISRKYGPTVSQQGPRVFVTAPDGRIFVLFVKGVAEVNSETHEVSMVAESPVPIGPGGDMLDGRIYFGSGSHVYSYAVPQAAK